MPSSRHQIPYGSIALGLYMLSLALPAIVSINKPILWGSSHDETMVGFQCLAIGWFTLPWYANIALWIAGIALAWHRPRVAAVASLTAVGLALTLFVYVGTYVRSPHVGYVAWLASMVVVFVAACARSRRDRELAARAADLS
jgi:hypothetical protein